MRGDGKMNWANKWTQHHLGFRPWTRHSIVLFVGGLAHVLMGYSYLFVQPDGPRYRAMYTAVSIAPLKSWAIAFMVIGIFAILSSVWPRASERWGYTVLTGVGAGWSAMYISGVWLTDLITRENFALGLLWAMLAFMWWAVSGLVNPNEIAVVVLNDAGD